MGECMGACVGARECMRGMLLEVLRDWSGIACAGGRSRGADSKTHQAVAGRTWGAWCAYQARRLVKVPGTGHALAVHCRARSQPPRSHASSTRRRTRPTRTGTPSTRQKSAHKALFSTSTLQSGMRTLHADGATASLAPQWQGLRDRPAMPLQVGWGGGGRGRCRPPPRGPFQHATPTLLSPPTRPHPERTCLRGPRASGCKNQRDTHAVPQQPHLMERGCQGKAPPSKWSTSCCAGGHPSLPHSTQKSRAGFPPTQTPSAAGAVTRPGYPRLNWRRNERWERRVGVGIPTQTSCKQQAAAELARHRHVHVQVAGMVRCRASAGPSTTTTCSTPTTRARSTPTTRGPLQTDG